MEAHRRLIGEDAGKRSEASEGQLRPVLVEDADSRGDLRFNIL